MTDPLKDKLQNVVTALGGVGNPEPPDGCKDTLGWYLDLICKLIIAGDKGSVGIAVLDIPTPPPSGTAVLKSIDGVLQWV
jgi:hypothetical protein